MTKNASASGTLSSTDSESLKIDFYESGQGDTIIITFPGGSMGIVDAHPSPSNSRADILEIIKGRKLLFVCLTHPHSDHGRDIARILGGHEDIGEFWHTNSDISLFIYRLQEVQSWPSHVRDFALQMSKGWAEFLIDLYGTVAEREELAVHQIRAGEEPRNYSGVSIYSLAPEEAVQQEFFRYWMSKAGDPTVRRPDVNNLSAILALRFGESVVVLGADALRRNWDDAIRRYRALKLPKAIVLKVPHHGASNALTLRNTKEATYFDICRHGETNCSSVLFSGDVKHPDQRVFNRLLSRTNVYCLINGRRGKQLGTNLGIEIDGARPAGSIEPCQPVVSLNVSPDGSATILQGVQCGQCRFAT